MPTPTSPHRVGTARADLGGLSVLDIEAPSLVEAHRALGALVGEPARAAAEGRIAAEGAERVAAAIAASVAGGRSARARARRSTVPALVRRGVDECFACLEAWAEGAGLGGSGLSALDVALWLQDDNTGCQTGMLRADDGGVLLWHTEEDTIGYLDAPRVVTLTAGADRLSAFVYPYLVPGPAFGWGEAQVHAVDSLHLRRSGEAGACTALAAWLVWRLGPEASVGEVARALGPFVDACAINVARVDGGRVLAETVEIGGRHVQARRLGDRPGSASFQANAVHRARSPLGRDEALTARERGRYERRAARNDEALERVRALGRQPGPADLIALMAGRRGGSYAYANDDVKGHGLARVSRRGVEVHARAGSASAGDVYRPSFRPRGGAMRVGVLPRGIDGLLMAAPEGAEVVALVERGAPEAAWARSFLAPRCVVDYRVEGDLGVYPSTEELLRRSDVHEAMRAGGVDALLLGVGCAPGTLAWAQQHGVRLLMTDFDEQRRLEDKLWFDAFLRQSALPVPAGGAFEPGGGARPLAAGPLVVQEPSSTGGEGTRFVPGERALDALVASGELARGRRYLVRERVDGVPYGVTVLVCPGRVALSAVRQQCYHDAPGGEAMVFAGVQWVATERLGRALRRRIDEALLALGDRLYRRRFFGFANVDFMVDRQGRVLLLECNPRLSAATPQLLQRPELIGGVRAAEAFLDGFRARRVYPRSFERSGLPESDFRGATLDVVHRGGDALVEHAHDSGVYRWARGSVERLGPDVGRVLGDRELSLFSFARPGQRCRRGDVLASLVAGSALYDRAGRLLPAARRLLAHFAYTRWSSAI